MQKLKGNIQTLVAIILAGALITGAIIYMHKNPKDSQSANLENADQNATVIKSIWEAIEPISAEDHILGNPDAEFTWILYFDMNCPHCTRFHKTLRDFMAQYGKEGKIKVVTRNLPLNEASAKEAEAAECVAELGGNEKFWEYENNLIDNPLTSDDVLKDELTKRAEAVGVNKTDLEECLENGFYVEKIMKSSNEAISLGAKGTPFSVLTNQEGKWDTIPGEVAYEDLEIILQQLIAMEE